MRSPSSLESSDAHVHGANCSHGDKHTRKHAVIDDDECDECDDEPSPQQQLFDRVLAVASQPPVVRSFVVASIAFLVFSWHQLSVVPFDLQHTSPVCFWLVVGVALLSVGSFAATILTDPGRVPPGYRVPGATAADCERARTEATLHQRNRYACQVRYCASCDAFKPPRAHHCSTAKRCVLRMSHYCAFAAVPIGLRNHKQFVLFLGYSCGGLLVSIVSVVHRLFISELELTGDNWILVVFTVIVWLYTAPNLVILFLQAVVGLLQNNTKIEIWERHWANMDAAADKRAYTYPYDTGNAFANAIEIFGTNPLLWFVPVCTATVDGLQYPFLVPKSEVV
jgi:hypothetical protein